MHTCIDLGAPSWIVDAKWCLLNTIQHGWRRTKVCDFRTSTLLSAPSAVLESEAVRMGNLNKIGLSIRIRTIRFEARTRKSIRPDFINSLKKICFYFGNQKRKSPILRLQIQSFRLSSAVFLNQLVDIIQLKLSLSFWHPKMVQW